jgi:hypothetical protein
METKWERGEDSDLPKCNRAASLYQGYREDISQHVRPRRRQCCVETPASKDLLSELVKSSSGG